MKYQEHEKVWYTKNETLARGHIYCTINGGFMVDDKLMFHKLNHDWSNYIYVDCWGYSRNFHGPTKGIDGIEYNRYLGLFPQHAKYLRSINAKKLIFKTQETNSNVNNNKEVLRQNIKQYQHQKSDLSCDRSVMNEWVRSKMDSMDFDPTIDQSKGQHLPTYSLLNNAPWKSTYHPEIYKLVARSNFQNEYNQNFCM